LALTSPTSGGRSVGIVSSWTKATEFLLFIGSEEATIILHSVSLTMIHGLEHTLIVAK
jgi:hypothetical protein